MKIRSNLPSNSGITSIASPISTSTVGGISAFLMFSFAISALSASISIVIKWASFPSAFPIRIAEYPIRAPTSRMRLGLASRTTLFRICPLLGPTIGRNRFPLAMPSMSLKTFSALLKTIFPGTYSIRLNERLLCLSFEDILFGSASPHTETFGGTSEPATRANSCEG